MSSDKRTIAVYDAKAADYAACFATDAPDRHLQAFAMALPAGAQVLDLGCGPGSASVALRAAGHHPDPVDASPAMVSLANERFALGARLSTFDDIDAVATYDGVWANFSLLHAARSDMPRHLQALHRALKPGGVFHIGMKTGVGETRDALDRFYTFYSRDELVGLLEHAGFTLVSEFADSERGLAGTLDPFLILLARA